jgi:hypothetical protein
VTAVETGIDARRALLGRLIDHAPLFPPASLPLPEALAADRRARASEDAWLLARLVWPASRLDVLPDDDRAVSVVVDVRLEDFVALSHKVRSVEAVELRVPDELSGPAGLAREVYVELAPDELQRLPSLAALGLRAKIRCGGGTVPSVEQLARFVRACREQGVVFKATAGLHHALPTRAEHGLLNLLAAAVFGDEDAALSETERAAFELDADSFRWRGREAAPRELARVRRELFASVGSCSFAEPVDELHALGVL